MKALTVALMAVLLLCSSPLLAEQQRRWDTVGAQSGSHTDVRVDMPPEVWTQGRNNHQPDCLRCCLFGNQQYSEGAVVKSEGVLLQCMRDGKSVGTNTLIWKIVRQ